MIRNAQEGERVRWYEWGEWRTGTVIRIDQWGVGRTSPKRIHVKPDGGLLLYFAPSELWRVETA